MKLDDIGFYTLTDRRARTSSHTTPLSRCELVLTDRCNFSCPYCKPLREDCRGDMTEKLAHQVVVEWASRGLRAIRFSGGEPTLWKGLPALVARARHIGVERIAISTNGSASGDDYAKLLDAGVDDLSISLDACCAATGDAMSGIKDSWQHTLDVIARFSQYIYVTVGVVLTGDNVAEAAETAHLAHSLGVDDIRIIPAAGKALVTMPDLGEEILDIIDDHLILRYRLERMKDRPIRGIRTFASPSEGRVDHNRCPLVLDDCAVAGEWHFPCIIYLRSGGEPIGPVADPGWRRARLRWAEEHDTWMDEICKKNCLDVCVDYNNRWRELQGEGCREWRAGKYHEG